MNIKNIRNNPTLKRISTLMGGTAIGQLAVLIAIPILSRIYSPEDFNDYGVYISFCSIASVIASLRIELSIPTTKDRATALLTFNSTILISAFIAVLSGFTIFLLMNRGFINISSNHIYLSVAACICIFLISFSQSLTWINIRDGNLKQIAISKAQQGISISVSQVILSTLFKGSSGLFIGDLVSRMSGMLVLYRPFAKSIKLVSISELLHVIRINKNYIKYSTPSGLVNAFGVEAPTLILASLYSPSTVGIFVFANRITQSLIGFTSKTLSQSYMSEFGQNSSNRLVIFRKYIIICIAVASISVIAIVTIYPHIVRLFGQQWLQSTKYVYMIVCVGILQIPAVCVSQTLNAIGRNSIQFYWDIFRLIAIFLSIYISYNISGSIYWSCIAYCIVSALAYLIHLTITWSFLKLEEGNNDIENSKGSINIRQRQ